MVTASAVSLVPWSASAAGAELPVSLPSAAAPPDVEPSEVEDFPAAGSWLPIVRGFLRDDLGLEPSEGLPLRLPSVSGLAVNLTLGFAFLGVGLLFFWSLGMNARVE
jgi:hypothetical protein